MARVCTKRTLVDDDGGIWHKTPLGYLQFTAKIIDIHVHGQCATEVITDGVQPFRVEKTLTLRKVAEHVVRNSNLPRAGILARHIGTKGMKIRYSARLADAPVTLRNNMRLQTVLKKFGFHPDESILYCWFPRRYTF